MGQQTLLWELRPTQHRSMGYWASLFMCIGKAAFCDGIIREHGESFLCANYGLMIGRKTEYFNPLNAELHPIYHLLALLGAHHILHVSRVRVNTVSVEGKRNVRLLTFSSSRFLAHCLLTSDVCNMWFWLKVRGAAWFSLAATASRRNPRAKPSSEKVVILVDKALFLECLYDRTK